MENRKCHYQIWKVSVLIQQDQLRGWGMCVKKKKATTSPISRNFFSSWSITNLCYQPAFCQAERHFHPCALAMLPANYCDRDWKGKRNECIFASELFFVPQLIISIINSWGGKVFLGQLLSVPVCHTGQPHCCHCQSLAQDAPRVSSAASHVILQNYFVIIL